jgi:hypothetical protein
MGSGCAGHFLVLPTGCRHAAPARFYSSRITTYTYLAAFFAGRSRVTKPYPSPGSPGSFSRPQIRELCFLWRGPHHSLADEPLDMPERLVLCADGFFGSFSVPSCRRC